MKKNIKKSTLNAREIEQFNKIADDWWDESSSFKLLHKLNPVRLSYIKDRICKHFKIQKNTQKPLKKLRIADIGCGGGLITEELSRLGARATGIDAGANNIKIAKAHAKSSGLNIDYITDTAEGLVEKKEKFDVIIALEIVEHVNNPELLISSCCNLLKKNGILILSTMNRTSKSFMFGVLGAEYIFNWMPAGTHDWNKFLKPSEIAEMLDKDDFIIEDICGMPYKALSKRFKLDKENINVNYLISAVHPTK